MRVMCRNCGSSTEVDPSHTDDKIPCEKCSFPIPVADSSSPGKAMDPTPPASKESVQINCECGQRLQIPRTTAQSQGRCPKCGAIFEIPPDPPATPPPSTTPAESSESRRPCPFCGDMIPSFAVKCRSCGEFMPKGGQDRHWRLASGRSEGVVWDMKALANGLAVLFGILVVIGTFLPIVDVILFTVSYISWVRYGEGVAILVIGALSAMLGAINIFTRKNLELTYLILGMLIVIDTIYVLFRLEKGGVDLKHLGAAPYLILIGGMGLFIIGLICAISLAVKPKLVRDPE